MPKKAVNIKILFKFNFLWEIRNIPIKTDNTSKIIALLKRLTYNVNERVNINTVVKYKRGSSDFISENKIMPNRKGKPIR